MFDEWEGGDGDMGWVEGCRWGYGMGGDVLFRGLLEGEAVVVLRDGVSVVVC